MSGIFGCVHFDRGPVDRAPLDRMSALLAHRGPDGSGLWIGEHVAVGFHALRTTPEALHEHQPLASEDGALRLVLDGRVDNRAQLLGEVRARGCVPRDDTDAELVLQAYLAWGEDCPVRIIGDFAFSIWNRRAQVLFCARDPMGMRPFFYFSDGERFVWASEPRPIFEFPGVTRTPNKSMVAQLLTDVLVSADQTIYRDIARLPAGHCMVVRPDRIAVRRYWDIDRGNSIRYRTDEEYAEHFRDLFREAVRCRMRSDRAVACELSGGLDSSSIVGMAQSLRAEHSAASPGLEVFSLVFPGRTCDEREYIEAVARKWGLGVHYREGGVFERPYYEEQVRRDWDLPMMPNGCMLQPIRELQAQMGLRVLLDGDGGDDWFTGAQCHLSDLARGLRLVELVRQARADFRVEVLDVSIRTVVRNGIWPLLPLDLRLFIRRFRGRPPAPDYVADELLPHLPSLRYRAQEISRDGFPSYAQAAMYRLIEQPYRQQAYEDMDRLNSRWQIEARSPLCDRRLVEFAFALPEDQRWRGSLPKFIMRNALCDLLPESIRMRGTKADFSPIVGETLLHIGASGGSGADSAKGRRWVGDESIMRGYNELAARFAAGNEQHAWSVWVVWRAFALGLWSDCMLGEV